MFLAGKVAWAGVVFLLIATGVSGPRPTPSTPGVDLSKGVPAVQHPNDLNRLQQTLLDKGYYRGKVDGVFGLQTRAGIRAFQKAENLSVTGQLDKETAGRLGVGPEVRQEARLVTTRDKPSAGTKFAKRSGRPRKTPQTRVEKARPVPPTQPIGSLQKLPRIPAAGCETFRRTNPFAGSRYLLGEHNLRPRLHQPGEPAGVPICRPHASMRLGITDPPRFRRAVDHPE